MILNITGGEVIIDNQDYELVSKYKWHIGSTGYAVWRGIKDGKKQTIRMHRLIVNTPENLVTDHINHNKLDNRRLNLRACTQSVNARNKTHQGKGYNWHGQNNCWNVETFGVRVSGFKTEEEAKEVVELIRNGGEYNKPKSLTCKRGHSLQDAYDYGKGINCKLCQKLRSKQYYARKKEISNVGNNRRR